MKAASTLRMLWAVPLVLIAAVLCPPAQGKVIRVDDDDPADFDRIQAGIDAAGPDDIVLVAPGTYRENVAMRDGVHLIGSGAEVTIIDANGHGDVVDARANNAAIAGFTLKNSGASNSPHMNCGIYVEGNYAPIVKANVIIGNQIGIGLWYGAHPDIRNNVIENNSDGLYLYGSKEQPTDPNVINNTIVGNQLDGIVLRERVSPVIRNNIIAGHATGINHNYVTGIPMLSYNDLWANDVNYLHNGRADDTLAGLGSLSVNPRFARPGHWADANEPNVPVAEPNSPNAVWVAGDYHLRSQAGRYDPKSQMWVLDGITSPCIDAGDPNSPVGFEPVPNGGVVNMDAYGGTAEASKSFSGRPLKYGGGTGEPNDPYVNPDIRDRCLVVQDISQADIFQGVEGECKLGWCEAHRGQTRLEEAIPDTLGDPNTPLYFIFAVHTCDDKLLDDPSRFRSGAANIRRIQNLLAEYGGMLSFQTSLRWAELTQDSNDQTLRWLAGQGCEIGLHLHDEYLIPRYLGLDYQGVEPGLALAQQQPVDVWMGAFQLIKGKVEAVSGVRPPRLFTGAPMCADRFYVGAKLGFQVTGDYKNPETRTTDERLAVLNPWRPAGSSDANEIATYDRNGPMVFVPSGVHPAHCQDSGGIPTPFNYASMDYVTLLLRVNLSCVSSGKINVFSVVFHPWDFEEGDFALWKTWLDSVMQPLLRTHRVQWSTVGKVAQLYETWESAAVPK